MVKRRFNDSEILSVYVMVAISVRELTAGGKFQRKLGNESGAAKKGLSSLSISQLKHLSKKHGIKVKGKVVEDLFDSYRTAPTKKQYVHALSKVVSQRDIGSARRTKPVKRRRRRQSSSSWSFW